MIIWIIGLAGSGKTTIGKEVYLQMKGRNPATVFLDGDDIRDIMGGDLGYARDDRYANAWRISRLCGYLDRQGIDVVCAILSCFQEHRDWCRSNFSRYFEIAIDVNLPTLRSRDQKGLYSGALNGTIRNVVGIDLPYDLPSKADMVIENSESLTEFSTVVGRIINALDAT